MENQDKTDNITIDESINNLTGASKEEKQKKFIFRLFYLLLIAFIALGGLFFYQKFRVVKSKNANEPSAATNLLRGFVKYTSKENDYEFYYPITWKVISEVPDDFMYVEMFNNMDGQMGINWFNSEDGLNTWLNGKMFVKKTCRGPILQNIKEPELLIAFDINKTNNDEPICFSAGYYFDTTKWKVSDKYLYPVGEDNTDNYKEVEWKGDFRVINKISTGQNFSTLVALVNRETNTLKGESDFSKIITSFKFIK